MLGRAFDVGRVFDVGVTLRASGTATPEIVWGRYTDLAAWPAWSPQIMAVTADSTRLSAGLTGTVHGPLGLPVRFQIDDVDEPGRTWSWHVRMGPVRMQLHHAVRERDGGGASTSLRIRGPAAVVFGYAPVAQLALSRLVRG